MSDELRARLRMILVSRALGQYVTEDGDTFTQVDWVNSPLIDDFADMIFDAFMDQGYQTSETFYERFETELSRAGQGGSLDLRTIQLCAKRAAEVA